MKKIKILKEKVAKLVKKVSTLFDYRFQALRKKYGEGNYILKGDGLLGVFPKSWTRMTVEAQQEFVDKLAKARQQEFLEESYPQLIGMSEPQRKKFFSDLFPKASSSFAEFRRNDKKALPFGESEYCFCH